MDSFKIAIHPKEKKKKQKTRNKKEPWYFAAASYLRDKTLYAFQFINKGAEDQTATELIPSPRK